MTSARLSPLQAAANWSLIGLFTIGALGCLVAALGNPISLAGAATSSVAVIGMNFRKSFSYALVVALGAIGLAYSGSPPVFWLIGLNGAIILAAIYVWIGIRVRGGTSPDVEA